MFSQVPIRIALKNSKAESQQTLGMDNSAAAFLRPREAIVNLDYGEVTQNRKTIIGFADEELLLPLRKIWWEKAKGCLAPYVFESEKRLVILNRMNELIEIINVSKIPKAVLGEKISVDGEKIAIPMSREYGRNIAIIGTPDSECNNAYGMMQSIAISLAVQHSNHDAKFIFCDFNNAENSLSTKYPEFSNIMLSLGHEVQMVEPNGFLQCLDNLKTEYDGNTDIYLFGSCMDRWEYERDPYGKGSPLKPFVESAPAKGVHFIGWWQKASNFNAQVSGFGNSDTFNTKVFLRVDERTVQSLTSPYIRWASQNNRALISDAVEFSEEITFIPYAPYVSN